MKVVMAKELKVGQMIENEDGLLCEIVSLEFKDSYVIVNLEDETYYEVPNFQDVEVY